MEDLTTRIEALNEQVQELKAQLTVKASPFPRRFILVWFVLFSVLLVTIAIGIAIRVAQAETLNQNFYSLFKFLETWEVIE